MIQAPTSRNIAIPSTRRVNPLFVDRFVMVAAALLSHAVVEKVVVVATLRDLDAVEEDVEIGNRHRTRVHVTVVGWQTTMPTPATS